MTAMKRLAPLFLLFAGLLGALSVAFGAAGMHAWRALLAANDPAGWFDVALRYHQFGVLGLAVVGLAAARFPESRGFAAAGWAMLAGIFLFSGSLYLRSLAGIHALHALTPFGGVLLIFAWLLFAVGGWRAGKRTGSI